jgi:hypothetical protein
MEPKTIDRNVLEEFKRRRSRQLIATVPTIAAMLPLIFAHESNGYLFLGIPITLLLPISLVIIIGMLIFSFTNWRCPSCNGYLGKRISPKYCSKCGIQLQV